jgi:hypothetical protein
LVISVIAGKGKIDENRRTAWHDLMDGRPVPRNIQSHCQTLVIV